MRQLDPNLLDQLAVIIARAAVDKLLAEAREQAGDSQDEDNGQEAAAATED